MVRRTSPGGPRTHGLGDHRQFPFRPELAIAGLIAKPASREIGVHLIITSVYPNSPAERSGLNQGDEIHAVCVNQQEMWSSDRSLSTIQNQFKNICKLEKHQFRIKFAFCECFLLLFC